jgi:DnaJ family protein C protein 9
LKDLKCAYLDYEGDMDDIVENVLCASPDDEDRFRDILQKLIKNKELPRFENFIDESEKKKKARKRKVLLLLEFLLPFYYVPQGR